MNHEVADASLAKRGWTARDLGLLVAIGGAMLVCVAALSHPELSVFHRLVAIGQWFRGLGPKPEVVTWPAWGYAWLVAWFPNFTWILVLQACAGAVALAALAKGLRGIVPAQYGLIVLLCVFAIPWHDMQVTLYPSGAAGSAALLALLVLDLAICESNLKIAVLAGVLCGIAQNFRTEFVLLPAFLGACSWGLRYFRIVRVPTLKPMACFVVVAFLMQLPWALFYHAESGRYSLTESNFGHVLHVSLGSRPDNPWGIQGDDQGAMQAVHDAGYPFSSLSEPGNKVLRQMVWQDMKLHPYAVVQRTLQQLRNTIAAPFNWGEPQLDRASALNVDVLRQELKSKLGVGINVAKLRTFRSENLYETAREDIHAKAALAYQIAAVGCGSIILVLGLLGMVLALIRAKETRGSLLLWLLALTALYKVSQDVLLAYQVNYLNNVYPMFLPFVAVSLSRVRGLFGRRPAQMVATP